jgi:hypothetical protein
MSRIREWNKRSNGVEDIYNDPVGGVSTVRCDISA